jgi:hypothetical protein
LSLVKTYNSIIEAVEDLNPNHKKLGISFTGRQIAISRYKNKSILVDNELGSFYFAKNPKSPRVNSSKRRIYQGVYPLILKDLINQTELEFRGIMSVQKYLTQILKLKPDTRTLKSCYINGTIYRKRFMLIPINKKN